MAYPHTPPPLHVPAPPNSSTPPLSCYMMDSRLFITVQPRLGRPAALTADENPPNWVTKHNENGKLHNTDHLTAALKLRLADPTTIRGLHRPDLPGWILQALPTGVLFEAILFPLWTPISVNPAPTGFHKLDSFPPPARLRFVAYFNLI